MLIAAGCGSSPTAPQGVPSPPTGAPASNSLPRATLSTPPERVEAGDSIEIAATVEDDETAPLQLAYAWSDDEMGGTFAPLLEPWRVAWAAPRALISPREFTFRLSVTEHYQDRGVPRSQQVSTATRPVHYNDSPFEVTRIATRFITELFSVYTVTAEEAVQDFADSCPGKISERKDVARNREIVQILAGGYTSQAVELNRDRTRATITGICEFRDTPKTGPDAGRVRKVQGVCAMTAVYEDWRWFLCESKYTPTSPTEIDSLRFRAPGVRNARNPNFGFR